MEKYASRTSIDAPSSREKAICEKVKGYTRVGQATWVDKHGGGQVWRIAAIKPVLIEAILNARQANCMYDQQRA